MNCYTTHSIPSEKPCTKKSFSLKLSFLLQQNMMSIFYFFVPSLAVTSFEALRTVKNDDQALQAQQSSCIQLYAAPTVLLHTQEQRTTEEFVAYFLKK